MNNKSLPGSLDGWSRAIEASDLRRQQAHKKLNEALGEPAVFMPTEDDPRFGTGYWKGQGGVFSYRKYANGYDPNTRMEYTDEFIDLLHNLKGS